MKRALAFVLVAGCSASDVRYEEYGHNPFPDVQTVAVLPVLNQTGQPTFDGEEYGNILASELLKWSGFRVTRPAVLRGLNEPLPRSVEDAVKLGRRLRVDAVLVAMITDHDPYEPPKAAVSVQFLRTGARTVSSADIDRMTQSASWRKGPFAMSPERAGHWIAAFEGVWDAHSAGVRRELVAYARAQEGSDTAFVGEREFLAVAPRYFQFVSNQLLRRLFEAAPAP
jgi:hypothetical protein